MKFRYDIGLAGAMGAVIGLVVAWALGWNLLLGVVIGAPVAFVLYKPSEVFTTIGWLISDGGEAAYNVLATRIPIGKILYGMFLVLIVIIGVSIIPWIVTGIALLHGMEAQYIPILVFIWVVLSVIMMLAGLCLLEERSAPKRHWSFPLCRNLLPSVLPVWKRTSLGKIWNKISPDITRKDEMIIAGTVPLVTIIFGILLIPILLLDIVFTIFLALASSERLAAMTGATFGCLIGALIAVTTSENPFLFVTGGGLGGYFSGGYLFAIRTWLSDLPVSRPTIS